MDVLAEMRDAVVRGETEECVELAVQALASGMDPLMTIQDGFVAGIDDAGRGFADGTLFLPHLVLAAEAMQAGVAVLEAALPSDVAEGRNRRKVVLATIQGDMHDLGKNMLRLIMSVSGFEVVDLGRDVKVATIIQRAKDENAEIIGASALMTTTMMYMKELIEELGEAGFRESFKVMVGGAPVTEEWARAIGADGYAKDAWASISVAEALLN